MSSPLLHHVLLFIIIFTAGFLAGYVLKVVLLQRQLRPGGELRRKIAEEMKSEKDHNNPKHT